MGDPPGPGRSLIRDLDRKARPARGHAPDSPAMNHILVAIAWAVVGAAGGWLVRWGSVRLAKLEELEPGAKPWQVWGPPIASALFFFDFEHRLILDRVIFPAMLLALAASVFNHPWWAGLATGIAAGLLFAVLALAGALIFKAEALGFGDVKFAAFMGLLLGPLPTIRRCSTACSSPGWCRLESSSGGDR